MMKTTHFLRIWTQMVKPLNCVAILASMIFSLTCYAEDPLSDLKLPNGRYVIERTSFYPQKALKTMEEAKEWVAAVRANSKLVSPVGEMFELWLQDDDFVVRAILRTNGGFHSKETLFVGMSLKESWAFEEYANTLTTVAGSFDPTSDPKLGLFAIGKAFASELRSLGLNAIQISSMHGISSFEGKTRLGIAVAGKIHSNLQGAITNVLCKIDDRSTPYEQNFDVSFDRSSLLDTRVLISNREKNGDWHPQYEYKVVQVELVNPFSVRSFWKNYTNSETQCLFYDITKHQLLYRSWDGTLRMLQPSPYLNSSVAHNNKRKYIVGIALVVSICVLVWILRLMGRRNNP